MIFSGADLKIRIRRKRTVVLTKSIRLLEYSL